MSHALVSTSIFAVELGSLLLANMLSAWLDAELAGQGAAEVAEHHRSKFAYVYLRQSTPGQVLHHQKSTETSVRPFAER